MTQEHKDLLLKDLCARLPYEVKIDNMGVPSMLTSINNKYRIIVETGEVDKEPRLDVLEIEDCKPYLFPLSSMTEEQMHDFFCRFVVNEIDYIDFKHYYVEQNRWNKIFTTISDCFEVVAWFNKNHFDAYGLIPMGLAINATGLNIY